MKEFTAIILAGGRSSRMGRDKALLQWQGKSLLDHAVALATTCGASQTIVLGRTDHELGVADRLSDRGPAIAILEYARSLETIRRHLVLPVDMPLLKPLHILALLRASGGGYFDGHFLPFVAHLAPDLDVAGDRMQDLLTALDAPARTIPSSWSESFINVNSPATWRQLPE